MDIVSIIQATGYIGLFAIVFSECGLLVGFFLPGDTLLFTAGYLASQDYLNIWLAIIILVIAGVLGNLLGYIIGAKFGSKVFENRDSAFFNEKNLHRSEKFFQKWGGEAVILARFVPIVRTFVPVFAGISEMKIQKYMLYNVIGGLVWTIIITLLGYYLGNRVPNIDKYILPVIAGIIAISVLPSLVVIFRKKWRQSKN